MTICQSGIHPPTLHSMLPITLSLLSMVYQLGFWSGLGVLFVAWCCWKLFKFVQVIGITANHPGIRSLLSSYSMLANTLPPIKYINDGVNFQWRTKRAVYDAKGTSIISRLSIADPKPAFVCSNPAAVKILNADRKRFKKPVDSYKILNLFGKNVVTTESEEWRKHRKIVAPGFSEKVFDLVWNTTAQIFFEMLDDQEWDKLGPGQVARVDDVPELILRLTLGVLATASFGAPLQWKVDTAQNLANGHRMSFADAITGVSANIIWLLLVPEVCPEAGGRKA